jgi:hypothetical protein
MRRRLRGLWRLVAGGAVMGVAALACALAATAGVAYGDVTSSDYTIGTPTGPVSSVAASPGKVAVGTSTNFEISFTPPTPLAGSASDWVSITPSRALGSTPTDIDLVGSSCAQAGTDGGAFSATGVTIDLDSLCSTGAGTKVEVDFTANAPVSTGTLGFTVTTSENDTPASSNGVTVTPAGPVLTAASYAFGANTTYTIGEAPVASLTSSGNSLTLTATAASGAGTIAFLNSGSGGAGYAVDYVPPGGGAATSDTVTNASASGATVTLTLATALVSGDTVDIVDFAATDAVPAGGYLYLTEAEGPTNFSTVSGIVVADNTQHWQFVVTGAILSDGAATLPLQDAVDAGDSLTITLLDVTNPPTVGTIDDFTVASTADPVPAEAPPYSITANATPGVLVTVDPSTTGALATYTLSNIRALGAMTGGSSTIKLEAPAGTVFPNSPSFYTVTDQTTPSGSGTVTAALSGGGSNVVTFTVPNSIEQGDELTLNVADVLNPNAPSSTDSITLVGAVTNLPPTAPPPTAPNPVTSTPIPTSTNPPTPPVTAPAPAAAAAGTISLDDTSVTVKGAVGAVRLTCTGEATCSGKLTLTAKTTKGHGKKKHSTIQTIGTASFTVAAGKTTTVQLELNRNGRKLLTSGHGRLIARLDIAKGSPAPPEAQIKTVHLSESKPAKKVR